MKVRNESSIGVGREAITRRIDDGWLAERRGDQEKGTGEAGRLEATDEVGKRKEEGKTAKGGIELMRSVRASAK
jgi:hypothetical protein